MSGTHNKDWWRGAVLYQIYPRSFSDSNGDGLGDLAGITARLDHVVRLGVDAVWISPFFTSPMKDFGYDVSNYCDVDPTFGTLADFDDLIARAHALGLKVMIDLVLSHTSDQHAWFAESRRDKTNAKADWYVWADAKPDGTPPNNWMSIFGGVAWTWDTRRLQYYMHNFLTEQPDLNFHNADVRAAVLGVVKFWLDRGADGFRLDTVNYYFHDQQLRNNPPAQIRGSSDVTSVNPYSFQHHIYDKTRPENLGFLKQLRELLDQYPDITTVGEVGAGERGLEVMGAYTQGGDKLHMCYAFDLLGPSFSAKYIRDRLEAYGRIVTDGWGCWAFSNHDVTRVLSRWGFSDVADVAAPLLMALLVSLRGSPCLYQGEELGLGEADIAFEDLQDPYGKTFWPQFKGRDGCRTPMPWTGALDAGFSTLERAWLPVPESHLARSVQLQSNDATSVFNRVCALLAWRKTQQALISGDMQFHDAPEPLLAFSRCHQSQNLLCIFNLGRAQQDFDLTPFSGLRVVAGHGFASAQTGKNLALPALSAFYALV